MRSSSKADRSRSKSVGFSWSTSSIGRGAVGSISRSTGELPATPRATSRAGGSRIWRSAERIGLIGRHRLAPSRGRAGREPRPPDRRHSDRRDADSQGPDQRLLCVACRVGGRGLRRLPGPLRRSDALHPSGGIAPKRRAEPAFGGRRGLHRRRRGGRRHHGARARPARRRRGRAGVRAPARLRAARRLRAALSPARESLANPAAGAGSPHHRRHPLYLLDGKRARGVGGSTLHWEGYAFRLHADDFRLRSLHGIADDWPISYQDLEPYYVRAEQALGVAGAADDPWASPRSTPFPLPAFPFSYSDGLFAPACRSLGIALHSLPQARNSVAYGGRAAVPGLRDLPGLPHGRQGQHRPHPHPGRPRPPGRRASSPRRPSSGSRSTAPDR